jgi:hypothetical protein
MNWWTFMKPKSALAMAQKLSLRLGRIQNLKNISFKNRLRPYPPRVIGVVRGKI